MNHTQYIFLVKSDLFRYAEDFKLSSFIYHYFLTPGFKYSFWMRTCSFYKSHPFYRIFSFPFAWLILNTLQYKYGFAVSYHTKIGSGLFLGHTGGIVVNFKVVIGKNCNISHQVTLGIANRGTHKGVPIIGDNVYIGPGAKIIGDINIGNNVAIGANCVVTKDVPDNAVVVGVPGKVISYEGSMGYVNKTNYE